MAPPLHRSRRKKRSRRQEVEAEPTTFQPIDDPNTHTPPTETLSSFPLEMDMSVTMSGAPHHASHDPVGHGVGSSFRGIQDGEATSRFDQVAVDAIQTRGQGLHRHVVINPQHSERRALHVE